MPNVNDNCPMNDGATRSFELVSKTRYTLACADSED